MFFTSGNLLYVTLCSLLFFFFLPIQVNVYESHLFILTAALSLSWLQNIHIPEKALISPAWVPRWFPPEQPVGSADGALRLLRPGPWAPEGQRALFAALTSFPRV